MMTSTTNSATDSASEHSRISKVFNDETSADLILRSSDDIRFFVRTQDLSAHSTIFAAAGECSGSETVATKGNGSALDIVDVSESSTTLETLLQFMRRQPQPDVAAMDFEMLSSVAEAAEKYEVYAAIQVLTISMSKYVKDHPSPIFLFAGRHGYTELAIDAAAEALKNGIDPTSNRETSGAQQTVTDWEDPSGWEDTSGIADTTTTPAPADAVKLWERVRDFFWKVDGGLERALGPPPLAWVHSYEKKRTARVVAGIPFPNKCQRLVSHRV